MAFIVAYIFYKNVFEAVAQFFFAFWYVLPSLPPSFFCVGIRPPDDLL